MPTLDRISVRTWIFLFLQSQVRRALHLMYRHWREVTKVLLSSKGPIFAAKLPKSKIRHVGTKLYVKWMMEEIKPDK